jgi:hypothetical protein
MQRYEILDCAFVVRFVISFLCIVIAYNSVSGELESGTLRLTLANSLSRGSWLAGGFLAHLTTLVLALVVGTLVSLLILSLNGALNPGPEVYLGYLMVLLCSTFYIALFLFSLDSGFFPHTEFLRVTRPADPGLGRVDRRRATDLVRDRSTIRRPSWCMVGTSQRTERPGRQAAGIRGHRTPRPGAWRWNSNMPNASRTWMHNKRHS